MPHDHDEGHGHSHAPPNNNAAFAIGVALNVGFVVAEVVYGLAANSLALLSDAGHNLSDVFGLLIAWGAIHISKSLPTKRHTYGWRRSSILAALTNAIVLLDLTGLSGVQAVHDLHIWGMSTTESALTVHLVMPQPPTNGEFLHKICHELSEEFAIGHVTVQIEYGDAGCHQAPADVV